MVCSGETVAADSTRTHQEHERFRAGKDEREHHRADAPGAEGHSCECELDELEQVSYKSELYEFEQSACEYKLDVACSTGSSSISAACPRSEDQQPQIEVACQV